MATKRARVNKTLEKAKKLISKKGKKKITKRAYPEGQNAPQSKAYDMENDKVVPAKRTGYRFTKEGAKKLGKQPNDKPTADEIEKYRNETFKVKGKVNKSGPTGVGDGSFRYLYIESRADKSDLNKARKLELGGYNPDEMLKIKIYVDVYEDDYEQGQGKNVNSYKVNWLNDPQVKASDLVKYLSEELYLSENPNDYVITDDVIIHTDQLQDEDGIHVNDEATLERWKKGEEKLYNAHYTIAIEAVKERIPDAEELSKATGIGTYAKGGEMFIDLKSGDFRNQILFDPKEVREFQKYVFSYYGKNGTFVDVMEEGIPATTGEVLKAVSQYLAYLSSPKKSTDVTWGNGDSFDREIVRDIIKYNRNPRAIVEYPFLIKDMKKTPILEYGGILQPMIGGVNADPRFDIYNTTMFAEKGAEVPEGDEYAKGGKIDGMRERVIDYYFENDVFDDYETYGLEEEDLKDSKKVEKAIIDYHDLKDPKNVKERYEVLGFDSDEYAKGGETKIYEVATKIKGKSGQFASSVRAKSKEDALRIYKQKHGDDKNKVIVDVYETTRKRLEDGGEMAKGGEITMATLKKREIKKINQLIEEYAHKGESIEFYEPFKINVNDADYLVTDVMEDGLYVTDSEGYDGGMPLSKLTFFQLQKVTSQIMDNIGEMAKGGSTHEQGYDDREDERLAMRHGKIASKDFIGSHKRREHSRRDDARFETRNK